MTQNTENVASSGSTAGQVSFTRPTRPLPSRILHGLWSFSRRKPLGAACGLLIILLAIVAVFAPALAPHGYTERVGPGLESPSSEYYIGTDHQGRDLYSRILYGSRSTILIGLGAAALATFLALSIGVTSGFLGGWVDTVAQRLVDTVMAVPGIVVVLAVAAYVGGTPTTIILLLGLLLAPGMSRVVRGATISVREAPFIEAARAISASTPRMILRHTVPNVMAPTIVIGTIAVGNAILAEAALSFLGFGVVPPTPSWGQQLGIQGRLYMSIQPWMAIAPGLAISITVFAFNMLGDALRDVLDPRLRNV